MSRLRSDQPLNTDIATKSLNAAREAVGANVSELAAWQKTETPLNYLLGGFPLFSEATSPRSFQLFPKVHVPP